MKNRLFLRKWNFIILVILITFVASIGVSLGKYKKTIDAATINLTILPKLATYTISGSDKILEKQSFIGDNVTATLANTGAERIVGSSTLTPDGLFIDDASETQGYWLYYYYVKEDNYSSAFDTSHIYYARCENRVDSIGSSYFNFGFMNLRHYVSNKVSDYGIPIIRVKNEQVSDDYKILSVWGFPKDHTDRVVAGQTYKGDYMDSMQVGTANGTILTSYTKNFLVLDLTAIFGAGNEPSQSWCDANIKFDTETITWYEESEQARLNGISDTLITSTSTQSISTMSVDGDLDDGIVIEYFGENLDDTFDTDDNIETDNNANEVISNNMTENLETENNANEVISNNITESLENNTNINETMELNSVNQTENSNINETKLVEN